MASSPTTQYDTPPGVGGQINTNTGQVLSGPLAGTTAGTNTGSTYSAGPAPTINASTLGTSATPLGVPTPPPPTDYSKLADSLISQYGTQNGEEKSATSDINTLLDRIDSSLAKQGTQSAEQARLEGRPGGVNDIQGQINELNKQILGLNNSAFAATNASEDRKAPMFAITGEQAQIARQRAVQMYGLSAASSALTGDLSLAQQKVQQAISAEFDPIKSELSIYQNLLSQARDNLSSAQSKKATMLQAQLAQVGKQQEQAQADKTQIYNTMLEASKNGADNQTLNNILGAKTPGDAILAAGNYTQNALDNQIKQQQLAKLNADIATAQSQNTAVSPDILKGMLNVYYNTGQMPAFGMSGKSPLRAQFYAALGGENGNDIVNDAATNKSIRAGITKALTTQQNQLAGTQTSIATLDKQLSLAQGYSDQVARSDSPLVNKYLLAAKQGVFGDPQTAALNNIVTTASYEFAKIMSGSSASIAGATVSSAADAKALLNSALSKGQFNEVLGLMRKEAGYRLQSQRDTISGLQNDSKNIPSLEDALATSTHNGVALPGAGANSYNGISLPF